MINWTAIFVLRERREVSWLRLGRRLRPEGSWLWGDAVLHDEKKSSISMISGLLVEGKPKRKKKETRTGKRLRCIKFSEKVPRA
jgi:hypothetical protein